MTKAPSGKCCAVDPLLWAVEWSPEQRCLHIDRLGEVLEMNLAIAQRRPQARPHGYILIAIFATEAEAEDFADALEPRLQGN